MLVGRDCFHHDHNHSEHGDHSHCPRPMVEERAARNEGLPQPGSEIFPITFSNCLGPRHCFEG